MATNVGTVNTYENTADTTLEDSNEYSRKSIIDKVHKAYAQHAAQGVTDLTNTFAAIATNKTTMNTSQKTMDNNRCSLILPQWKTVQKKDVCDCFICKTGTVSTRHCK